MSVRSFVSFVCSVQLAMWKTKEMGYIYMAWFSFMWHLAPRKWHIFFPKPPSKSAKNGFFPHSFHIFLFILVSKLQKFWVSDLGRNLGCAPYAQSWVFFENFEKTPNFGCMVHTLDYTSNLKLLFSEAYTQRSIGICKKN